MQGRLLFLTSRRLRFSTAQLGSIRRLCSSGDEALTENPQSSNSERPIQQSNPEQNFASRPISQPHPNPNPSLNPHPNLQSNREPTASNLESTVELHPTNPNPPLVVTDTNPSFDASLPQVEKCIWAVERLSKGKKYTRLDKKQKRVPGFVCEQDSPHTEHVLILMDKFQIQNLWCHLGEEKFLGTVFTLEVFDGFGSNNVLYRERVLPRRINFNKAGEITNVGYARAPPGMKLRLDVPIRILGQEHCLGLRKGGFLKVYSSYVSLFCLPEELPAYVEIHVNEMDIGDRICVGDLRIGVPLHADSQPLLPICEIVQVNT